MTASLDRIVADANAVATWHSMPAGAVLSQLDTTATGLTAAVATARLQRHGLNTLPEAPPPSLLRRFLAQFDNLFIYVLLGSAVVTALLGHLVDAGVIGLVVLLNALIGVLQEGRAESALAAIRDMVKPRATVLRDGNRITIDASGIVPGDVLVLEPGDQIAADVRLISGRALRIDEAILTGESVPVDKSAEPVALDAVLAERTSMAYSGTLVAAGSGLGVVIATGKASELGQISALLGRVGHLETPLTRQMNALARQLTFIILAVSALTGVFAVVVRDYALADAFLAMVGMAVAAIPEGLPAVMTITLAIGVQRMAARNAIIRRLPAVETLGAVSTICSDKTGTLTRNEMTVNVVALPDRLVTVTGGGYAPGGLLLDAGGNPLSPQTHALVKQLAEAALSCSDAVLHDHGGRWSVEGDPMEGALAAFAGKAGVAKTELMQRLPRIDVIPFDARHRYMATLHDARDGSTLVTVKGAPEAVLAMCTHERTAAGDVALDPVRWAEVQARLGGDGQRVLAVASRRDEDGRHDIDHADVADGLTLHGLVGLLDPPRPEVVAAIAECRAAGIRVKMITGDHAITASAIARALGLEHPGAVAEGHQLDDLDAAELATFANTTSVFARTSPEHKLDLVAALQSDGAVVAMTGDGVNDSPALKQADVGVAMGRKGTEAAKGAADMVLADDNFASIVAAVREGRTVRDNLTKVIAWTLPTSGGETLVIAAAILLGLTLPVTPVQILWINMVTAIGLGLVLAFEPAEPGIMARRPRPPYAPILTPFLVWRTAFVAVLFATGAFAMFAWARGRGLAIEEARTIVVNTIVVMEIFYLFAIRYLHGTSMTLTGLFGTPAVLIGIAGTTAAQFAYTYWPPMQALFGSRAVGMTDGLAIIAVGIAMLAILEVEKQLIAWLGWPIRADH